LRKVGRFITTHQGGIDAGDEEAEARLGNKDDGDGQQAAETTKGTNHRGTGKKTR
jgi:hypothetical protein